MDSISSMNNALAFIESHFDKDLDYSQVAKIACCSEFHFKRMFSFISGISLSEYVRRRRLTLAALDLKDSNNRIMMLQSNTAIVRPIRKRYSHWSRTTSRFLRKGPEKVF